MAKLTDSQKQAIVNHYKQNPGYERNPDGTIRQDAFGNPILKDVPTEKKIRETIDKVERWNTNNFSSFLSLSGDWDIERQKVNQVSQQCQQKVQHIINDSTIKLPEKFRSLMPQVIKSKLIPHVKDFCKASEYSDDFEGYEMLCSLKAFSIEYSTKAIHAMAEMNKIRAAMEKAITEIDDYMAPSKTPQDIASIVLGDTLSSQDEKKEHIWNIFNTYLIGSVKTIAEVKALSSERLTGHEINNMVNGLPSMLSTMITYKTLSYMADETVSKQGKIPVTKQYINGIDMILSMKEYITADEVKEQQGNQQENNSAFVDLRYIERLVKMKDYRNLSALSAASMTMLDFALKNEKLIDRQLNPNDNNLWQTIFTPKEYQDLQQLITNNPNCNKENLLYYYAFIKTYLTEQDKLDKFDMNDEKYKNINKLFEIIKSNNNIAQLGESFLDWYHRIDVFSLTREELEELEGLFPEYFFKSLSYADKIAYKICKQNNIKFELYYKLNFESFEEIISLCSPEELADKKIDLELLTMTPKQIQEYSAFLKTYNQSLIEVPYYYFRYSIEEIKMALRESEHLRSIMQEVYLDTPELPITLGQPTSKYLSIQELKQAKNNVRKEQYIYDEIEGFIENSEDYHFIQDNAFDFSHAIQYATRTANLDNNTYWENDETLRRKIIEIKNLLHQTGPKSYVDLINMGYKPYEVQTALNLFELGHEIKKEDSTMQDFRLEEIQKLNKNRYSVGETTKKNQETARYIRSLDIEKDKYINSSSTIENMMDQIEIITPGMKKLSPKEVLQNYMLYRELTSDDKIGAYLLYKTPSEVMDMIHATNGDIDQDLFYIDNELLSRFSIEEIRSRISSAKDYMARQGVVHTEEDKKYEMYRQINSEMTKESEQRAINEEMQRIIEAQAEEIRRQKEIIEMMRSQQTIQQEEQKKHETI